MSPTIPLGSTRHFLNRLKARMRGMDGSRHSRLSEARSRRCQCREAHSEPKPTVGCTTNAGVLSEASIMARAARIGAACEKGFRRCEQVKYAHAYKFCETPTVI